MRDNFVRLNSTDERDLHAPFCARFATNLVGLGKNIRATNVGRACKALLTRALAAQDACK
jgi:hypothetical protein